MRHCASVAIVKNRLALFDICVLTLDNPKRMPVFQILFTLLLVSPGLLICVMYHEACTCGPDFGQRVTKLGLAALSFWREMVSGFE